MPRMSGQELGEILTRGYKAAEMEVEPQTATAATITRLSMGLPHYTHLLGLHAGTWAAASVTEDQVPRVSHEHLMQALPKAVSRAQAHVSRLYHDATHSTQANTFREVLLGAAVCKIDDRGYFAPGDLRQPLSRLLGRPVAIPSFFAEERAAESAPVPIHGTTSGAVCRDARNNGRIDQPRGSRFGARLDRASTTGRDLERTCAPNRRFPLRAPH